MREALGVPRTWYGQYAAWFGKMLQGNFGNSIRTGLPVLPELARVGVNTLYLTLGSLVLTLLIAVPIAVTPPRTATPPATPRRPSPRTSCRRCRCSGSATSWSTSSSPVRHVPAALGNRGEAAARLAVFPRPDLRPGHGERDALRADPPPARGAVARPVRGLH